MAATAVSRWARRSWTPAAPSTSTAFGGGATLWRRRLRSRLSLPPFSGSANFAISASPASLSIQQGNQGTSTITTTISGGFNSAITLSASGVPSGTTVSFNPNPIPAPGAGSSTMTITVGSSTPAGTYPITVTGNGGGIQQNTTVTLTVLSSSAWAIGFDFRASSNYVTDPPGDTYVLASTAYPTTFNGVNFGWTNVSLVQARNRSTGVDPRLAGMNYVTNGSPATFYVDLPASGTYNLSLAMGDDGYQACSVPVPDSVPGWQHHSGYAYGRIREPGILLRCAREQLVGGNVANQERQSAGGHSRHATDDGSGSEVIDNGSYTPIAFLGVTEVTLAPNFLMSALADFAQRCARKPGNVDDYDEHQRWFQQHDQSVGLGDAVRNHREFQSQPDTGAGRRQLDDDHHRRQQHTGGNLPHHRDRQWRRRPADCHRHPDGDRGQQPDFILTVSPPTVTVAQGSAGNTTVRTTLW